MCPECRAARRAATAPPCCWRSPTGSTRSAGTVFIGHPGVALATKAAAPRVGLSTLFIAAMRLDLIWPAFLLLGIETVRIDPAYAPGSTTGNRRRDTRETRIA